MMPSALKAYRILSRHITTHMGIILIREIVVVSSSRQQSQQPATARVKARGVPILVWSPGVRVESRRPKSRPVASTGVQIPVC